jgi:TolA-binding protein
MGRRICQWLMLGVLCWALPAALPAATPEEEAAFRAAARAFQNGFFERTDRELTEFARRFPESEHLPEATLLQAQSRYQLKRYDDVIALLSDKLAGNPAYTHRYRYWLGEALFQKGDFDGAAREFGALLEQRPDSLRALDASHGQALALFKLGQTARVVELLRHPEGAFQRAAGAAPDSPTVTRGRLLLAEALLAQGEAGEARATLDSLASRNLAGEQDWRRQHLLARVQLARNELAEARQTADRLNALATELADRELQAESVQMLGRTLERLADTAGALAAYERNLVESVPPVFRRQAWLRIIDLLLSDGKTEETVKRLEQFITQAPEDPVVDLAHLTIGELRLRDFYTYWAGSVTNQAASPVTGQATNLLIQAQQHLDRVIDGLPNSPQVPKARLARGWCHWGAGRFAESAADFQAATEQLPLSRDQLVARFKWADALLRLNEARGALTNYQAVAAAVTNVAGVDRALAVQAWYQVVHAAALAGDLAAAESAAAAIFRDSPENHFAQPALLLVGESATSLGQSAEARRIFQRFLEQFPDSALVAEARLAIARTHVQERDWPGAVAAYERWLADHEAHAASPQALFAAGWACDQAGSETNALAHYTRFLEQFPNHALAPVAQTWVADHFFRAGMQNPDLLVKAEEGYLRIFQSTNWPVSEWTYQAQLAAARAASARQGFKEARGYLTNLINNTQAPSNVVAQAFIAFGDVTTEDADPARPPGERWEEAIKAYGFVTNRFRGGSFEPLALGRIAHCQFQLGAQDAARYAGAADSFQKVVDSPQAGFRSRAEAKVGLALVSERQARLRAPEEQSALLDTAINHCLDVVFFERLLRPDETPDRFWVQQAGLTAAPWLIELGRSDQAQNIYRELQRLYPAQKEFFQRLSQPAPVRTAPPGT